MHAFFLNEKFWVFEGNPKILLGMVQNFKNLRYIIFMQNQAKGMQKMSFPTTIRWFLTRFCSEKGAISHVLSIPYSIRVRRSKIYRIL